MLLACVHNFGEAIRDLNAAVSLSEGGRAECFLLRSRCLQIEGEGSDAFRDLQEYIGRHGCTSQLCGLTTPLSTSTQDKSFSRTELLRTP